MPEIRSSAPDAAAQVRNRPRMSPAARRRAQRLDVSPDDIVGTGPAGRILLRDLERATVTDGFKAGTSARWTRRAGGGAIMARPARPPLAQVNVSAHCQVDTLLAQRNALRRNGQFDVPGLSSLFVKALGLALRQVPAANVTLDGDRVVAQDACNVAYTVADRAGQVAFPVVANADQRPIREIASAIDKAISRNRDRFDVGKSGEAEADELTATSAIANLGAGRVTRFDTAVSRPHASVLAIPSPERVVVPGFGGSGFRCETRLTFTLGCDSRLVSGLVAAQLLEAFIALIETPDALFV